MERQLREASASTGQIARGDGEAVVEISRQLQGLVDQFVLT